MPRRNPDHRARATVAAQTAPEHAFENALWHIRRGRNASDVVERAIEMHEGTSRDSLRGWLLAAKSDADIAERTRINLDVIRAYRHLFFDVTVFRDHFDLVEWANELTADPSYSAKGLQFIRWAIMYGVEAVAFLSGLPVHVDARQVQEQTMSDSHFLSLMGRDNPLDSAVAKEALKHRQVAIQQAAMLAKASPPSARDFAVKLKHREMTTAIEVVDKTTEVLH